LLTYKFAEIARDSLHSTGQYKVVGGIISPVSDRYSRKVSSSIVSQVLCCLFCVLSIVFYTVAFLK